MNFLNSSKAPKETYVYMNMMLKKRNDNVKIMESREREKRTDIGFDLFHFMEEREMKSKDQN